MDVLRCGTCGATNEPLYSQPDRLRVYCLSCSMLIGAQMKQVCLEAEAESEITVQARAPIVLVCLNDPIKIN